MAGRDKGAERGAATAAAVTGEDDVRLDLTLRPKSLDAYIGQDEHRDNLKVFVAAARKRQQPLDHVLISGPPGLGKTTLACAVGRKLGREVYIFQCTMDTRPEDLLITPVLST